jgi:hypothetical protein
MSKEILLNREEREKEPGITELDELVKSKVREVGEKGGWNEKLLEGAIDTAPGLITEALEEEDIEPDIEYLLQKDEDFWKEIAEASKQKFAAKTASEMKDAIKKQHWYTMNRI